MFCALFADEIITLVLGQEWPQAVPIFRLMTPTILVFGIVNPLFWVMVSLGLQKRSLYIGLVLAPLVVAAYSLGAQFGPNGVALGYSTVMVLWLFPHVAWCLHGTPVSVADLAKAIAGPFAAGLVAAACAFVLMHQIGQELPAVLRLAIGGAAMAAVYGWILLFVLGYRSLYASVLAALGRPSTAEA
jgi:PST family polysaccharide transporter